MDSRHIGILFPVLIWPNFRHWRDFVIGLPNYVKIPTAELWRRSYPFDYTWVILDHTRSAIVDLSFRASREVLGLYPDIWHSGVQQLQRDIRWAYRTALPEICLLQYIYWSCIYRPI